MFEDYETTGNQSYAWFTATSNIHCMNKVILKLNVN